MKRNEIEQGATYEGKSGEQRQIMRLDSWWLRYRVVFNTKRPARVGYSNSIFKGTFASWAQKRIQ